jgi:hypothetical protein
MDNGTDKLTRRYAKALTAEVETRFCAEEAKAWAEAMRGSVKLAVLEESPKLAEWKVNLEADVQLAGNMAYKQASDHLLAERHAHAKAKARLAVIEDAVKRRRAREYGELGRT